MSRFPRITIVTPSLNQGAYLEQCIRSVVSQGYPDLEHFVIDGGSTDESVSIIRKHAASIAYWVSEPDGGQSDAINKGLRRATGDVVAWLNADDYYLPGALERVAEAYSVNPDAPFYFGDGVRIDQAGNERGRFCAADRLVFDREALVFGLNYILQPATFINRKALETSGLLDTGLHYGMDSDLWMRLSALGEPLPIQAFLAATREYAATKTALGLFKRIEELREISLRHSGAKLTPGVLCYLLDTLYRQVEEREDIFPRQFRIDLIAFWKQAQKLLARYGAGPDGFPRGPLPAVVKEEAPVAERPLKIGIDLRQLVLGASGGISQLVKGVFESAFALHPEHEFLVFCTPFNRSLLDGRAVNARFFSLSLVSYFADLNRIALEEELDVLIRAYPMEDTLAFPLSRQIVVIPDNQHEVYPEFFSAEALRTRRVAFARALGEAGAIGAISGFAMDALRNFPGTRCRDFFLMPPALQRSHSGTDQERLSDAERALIPDGDYFLFPANLWKHKNHLRMLRAFRLFVARTGRKVSLVLTGHPEGWMDLAGQFPGVPVRHLGFVQPELLRALYERASALVFFSLYEGFGIPLLEAFDAGIPVVCSDTTSLPEVAGDAALMCDPTDIEAMAGLMERISSEGELRGELVRRGRARLSAYSWEQSAHNLMGACIRVANSGQRQEPGQAASVMSETPAAAPAGPLPLVSIVTPSYNQGRFLRRTIDSVLGQSYPKMEYVVIDGGSKDESVDILRSYGDRVSWISEADGGQAHAINKGMARVSGEILAYLNSDDVLLPGAIARVVKFFRENPECDMVYGDADYIDEEDRVTGAYRTAPYSFPRLMEACMVCQPAAFWRRRISDQVGPFNEQLEYAMDYDYWLRIDRAGGVIRFLPEKLACSRRYPETKTLSARAAIHVEIFKVCKANTGDVHQNFFTGYWQHLFHEHDALWSRLLRRVPDLEWRIAWLHHKWYTRDRITRRDVAMFLYEWVKVRVIAASRWVARPFRTALRTPSGSAVAGYKRDNWVEPVLSVPSRRRAPGHSLHLAGIAPLDTVATVWAGDIRIGIFPLPANQYREISFPADAVGDSAITIRFSNDFVDGAKRRLSFLLQDTNLFAEHDTLR